MICLRINLCISCKHRRINTCLNLYTDLPRNKSALWLCVQSLFHQHFDVFRILTCKYKSVSVFFSPLEMPPPAQCRPGVNAPFLLLLHVLSYDELKHNQIEDWFTRGILRKLSHRISTPWTETFWTKITSPTKGDGRLFSPASEDICLWTASWRQFKSDCHQTSSVIPLATGDDVNFGRSRSVGEIRTLLSPSSL